MGKAEFIIVPGAWHGYESFEPTIILLEQAGYKVHGISHASVGASPELKNFNPDVEIIQAKVHELISAGKDLVIVYHSYGSVPGSEALKKYVKELESGDKKNGQGSVKRLVYCCSFVFSEGETLMAGLGGKDLPWFQVDGDTVTPANPEQVFYNDIAPEIAAKYVAALKTHSYPTFSSVQTVAPWKVIPSTYIACERDLAIPIQVQDGMVAKARAKVSTAFDVVERVDASHSPFISQPQWLADKLAEAAGAGA